MVLLIQCLLKMRSRFTQSRSIGIPISADNQTGNPYFKGSTY